MAGLYDDCPSSLEAVRRKVANAIHAVEKETDLFLHRQVKNLGEPERWCEVIEELCAKQGKRLDDLDDFKDLHQVLVKFRTKRGTTPYPELAQLKRMVDRGKVFEYIAFSLRNDLVTAYNNYLKRYCLSFQPEARGQELHSVTEYENSILEWKDQMKTRMDKVDALLDESDGLRSPLTEYISQYERVVVIMRDTCKAMRNVSVPMKKWLIMDSAYAKKLQDEWNQYSKRKMDIRDISRQLEFDREQNALRLRRRAFFDLKGERALKDVRDDKRLLKHRERECQENYDKVGAEITRKQRDLEEIKSRFSNRKENSPALYNYLTGLMETMREDIWKLESKQDVILKQLIALKKQLYDKQKDVDKLQNELDLSTNNRDRVMDRLHNQELDLNSVKTEAKILDLRIVALKRIREIKLHNDTVKKIYYFGYHPGKLEKKADLDTAFRITATDMGKDWASMYRELPFKPPRDLNTRNLDIEIIDRNLRYDPHGAVFYNLALKSLEKWKRLSTVASLPELLSTLKKIKRRGTVQKIERQMRTMSG